MKYFIYLDVEPYIRQWLEHDFLNNEQTAIAFPRGTVERDIIKCFIAERPEDCKPQPPNGRLAIEIPEDKLRSPERYNYLKPAAVAALKTCIYNRFRMQVWNELHQFKHCDRLITDIIAAWMEKKGIEYTEKNWETIRQMYFRQRQKYQQKTARNQKEKSSKQESLK